MMMAVVGLGTFSSLEQGVRCIHTCSGIVASVHGGSLGIWIHQVGPRSVTMQLCAPKAGRKSSWRRRRGKGGKVTGHLAEFLGEGETRRKKGG